MDQTHSMMSVFCILLGLMASLKGSKQTLRTEFIYYISLITSHLITLTSPLFFKGEQKSHL